MLIKSRLPQQWGCSSFAHSVIQMEIARSGASANPQDKLLFPGQDGASWQCLAFIQSSCSWPQLAFSKQGSHSGGLAWDRLADYEILPIWGQAAVDQISREAFDFAVLAALLWPDNRCPIADVGRVVAFRAVLNLHLLRTRKQDKSCFTEVSNVLNQAHCPKQSLQKRAQDGLHWRQSAVTSETEASNSGCMLHFCLSWVKNLG